MTLNKEQKELFISIFNHGLMEVVAMKHLDEGRDKATTDLKNTSKKFSKLWKELNLGINKFGYIMKKEEVKNNE